MLTAQDLNNLLSQFVDYLLSSGASRATIKNYSSDLGKIFSKITSDAPVSSENLYYSLEQLKQAFSEATVRRFGYSLKSFVAWAKSQGYNLEVTNQPTTLPEVKNSPIENYIAQLNEQGAPKTTVENYTKDLSRFLFWVKPTAKTLADVDSKTVSRVNTLDIKRYINYLKSKSFSEASINRYLFSLKDFFKYNKKDVVFDNNPVRPSFLNQNISNQPRWKRLMKYRPFWWHAYRGHPMSDYINWAALAVITLFIGLGLYQNLYPQKIVQVAQNNNGVVLGSAAPPRVLSFQGRLTNTSGTPIVTATNVVFKIYSVDTAGSPLWTSKTWSITPDQNGILSACLGDTTTSDICLSGNSGGSPPYTADTAIPANLFTDNPSLYLGVTIGSDSEAAPRQRIASSTYALNAGALNSSFSSATNNDFGNSISATNASTTGTVAISGIVITPTGTFTSGTNTINLVNFATPLTPNSNNFYGLNFTTGYTDILRYNNTTLISGTGVTGAGLTLALGASTITGTLGLGNGGTNGTATPTNGAVAYGNGIAFAFTAGPSGSGSCLLSGSGSPATPTWGNCATGSGTAVLLAPALAQADSTNNNSIFINKTGASGNLLDLQNTNADKLVVTNSGTLVVGGSSPLANDLFDVQGSLNTVSGSAYGINESPTINAMGTSDVLVGTRIAPTIATSTYSGLTTYATYIEASVATGSKLVGNAFGLYINPPSFGTNRAGIELQAGTAGATSSYGLFLQDQGSTTTANATGIYVAGPSATTTSYGINISNANGSATTKTAINIGTGWNTGLSITSNSSTNGDSALNIGYTSANSGTPTQAAIDLTLTNNNISAGNTLYGQRITNAGSAVSVTTALLDLNNANPNASSVTNGIIFNNSGGTAASYDNGINFTPVTSFTNGAIISKITGGNLINNSGSATQTSGITGVNLDFNTTFTGSTGANITGINFKTPALTATSATTYTGFNIPTAGAIVSNGGNFNWYGANIKLPAVTQTANTALADGVFLDMSLATITTGGTVRGIDIGNTASVGAGTIQAINIGTASGAATKTAINIGSGWDTGLAITGTTGQTTQSALNVSGYNYSLASGTTSLVSLGFTNSSGPSLSTINGLTISPTVNGTSGGYINNNSINIAAPIFGGYCASNSANCTVNGLNIATASSSSSFTIQNAINIAATDVTGNSTLRAINISGITGSSPTTETAINVGLGWGTVLTGSLANLTSASATGVSITNGNTTTTGIETAFAVQLGSAGAGTTQYGLNINQPTFGSGTGTTTAINISPLSSGGTDTAINIGVGWPTIFRGSLASLTNASATGVSITNGNTTTTGIETTLAAILGSAGSGTTQNGLLITPPSSTGTGTTNGINIGSIATSNGIDTAININSGWKSSINGVGTLKLSSSLNNGNAVAIGTSTSTPITLNGSYTGLNLNLSSNYTATNNSAAGINITLPAPVNTTGGNVFYYQGLAVSSGAALSPQQNNGFLSAATIFSGVDITNPNITTSSGFSGSLFANGLQVSTGSVNGGGSGTTEQNGLNINLASTTIANGGTINGLLIGQNNVLGIPSGVIASGPSVGSLYGININGITTPGTGTQTAINIGSGWDVSLQQSMTVPGQPSGTASTTGGSMATAIYYYVITAFDGSGETTKSTQSAAISVTGPTGSVALSWTAVTGAASYKIYRTTTTNTYTSPAYIANPTTNSYTDIAASPTTGAPPDTNTAYLNKINSSGNSRILGGNILVSTNQGLDNTITGGFLNLGSGNASTSNSAVNLATGQTTPAKALGLAACTPAGADYNMGYSFTPTTNGAITQLGGRWDSGTRTVFLYTQADGVQRTSASVTGAGVSNWTYAPIPSYPVTAGTSYVVSVRSGSGNNYCYNSLTMPTTSGAVKINNSLYIATSNNMPNNPATTIMYGEADVVFQPYGNNIATGVISGSNGPINLGGSGVTTNILGFTPTSGTENILNIGNPNGTNLIGGAGNINGINVAPLTSGSGTENAINIGSGWDTAILANGTGTIKGTNVVAGGNSNSPAITLEGNGYTGPSTNQTGSFSIQTQPGSATTAKLMFSVTGFVATANVFSIDQAGNIRSAGTDTNSVAPDIAENVPVADMSIAAGDIVEVDPTVGGDGTTYNNFTARKSTSTYSPTLLGVISTDPGIVLNGPKDLNTDARSLPNERVLTIAGRVPTKVSTENGPIVPGDPLTSSSTPGVAMKATQSGLIIGTALESYSDTTKTGKILVFVHTGYYPGSIEYQNAHSNPPQLLTLDANNNITATVSAGASFIWKNTAGQAVAWVTDTGEAVFTKITALIGNFQQLIFGELVAKKSSQIAGQASFNSTDTEVTIAAPKVKSDSLINLTPTSKTNGVKLYIKEIKEGVGFTVALERDGGDQPKQATASATAALKFNWFIINQQ